MIFQESKYKIWKTACIKSYMYIWKNIYVFYFFPNYDNFKKEYQNFDIP